MNDPSQCENIYLSIVIPLFNEEGNIKVLVENIVKNLTFLKDEERYEIILIDDGSSDKTWTRIQEESSNNASVLGISLARNFGHQHALLSGLCFSRGKAVITMDGDMQHPPSVIKKLVEKYKEGGSLVVNTKRNDKEVSSFFKRKSSQLFYKFFSFFTDVDISSGTSDFRLMDRLVVEELIKLKDVDLFLRGAVEWLGFSSVTIPYNAGERFAGVSKYTLIKMFIFAKGAIISFSTKPLVLGVWLGIITSTLSFLEILYIFHQVLKGQVVPGWASTVGVMAFLFGILFIILGIIGVYLSRIHVALQNRPRFIVKEIIKYNDN